MTSASLSFAPQAYSRSKRNLLRQLLRHNQTQRLLGIEAANQRIAVLAREKQERHVLLEKLWKNAEPPTHSSVCKRRPNKCNEVRDTGKGILCAIDRRAEHYEEELLKKLTFLRERKRTSESTLKSASRATEKSQDMGYAMRFRASKMHRDSHHSAVSLSPDDSKRSEKGRLQRSESVSPTLPLLRVRQRGKQ